MSLPIRTTLADAIAICSYLVKKPTGASTQDAKKVLDAKHLDPRKINAYKFWGLVEDADGKLKISDRGRSVCKSDSQRTVAFAEAVKSIPAYLGVLERVVHRGEDSLSATDVAAHWHQHYSSDASENDKILNDQAVCFFQLAQGAGLGQITIGRVGQPTRFTFSPTALGTIIDSESDSTNHETPADEEDEPETGGLEGNGGNHNSPQPLKMPPQLQQGIFIAHGKNKKPLDQLRRILDQFKVPYKVAGEEPNLGRPIGTKVKQIMESCNCAILIFTADEEFRDLEGKTVWRPSENVIHELGASSYLYESRIVIMKEEEVTLASNFRELGYISFSKDALEAKTMDVLKELIGFGIVKIST